MKATRSDQAPLAPTQRRFWLTEQSHAGTAFNNVAVAYRLSGPLDPTRFEKAVEQVVAQHPVLAIEVIETATGPVQAFDTGATMPVELIDVRGNDVDQQLAIDTIAAMPFDIHSAPLIRMHLLRVGADEHVFLMVLHHLVGDGWSLGIFLRTLTKAYNLLPDAALDIDRASGPAAFGEYASLMASDEQRVALEPDMDYWRQALDPEVRPVTFPSASDRAPGRLVVRSHQPDRQRPHNGTQRRRQTPVGVEVRGAPGRAGGAAWVATAVSRWCHSDTRWRTGRPGGLLASSGRS